MTPDLASIVESEEEAESKAFLKLATWAFKDDIWALLSDAWMGTQSILRELTIGMKWLMVLVITLITAISVVVVDEEYTGVKM